MKRKIFSLVVALCLFLPILCSCNIFGNSGNQGNNDGSYTIVYGSDEVSKDIANKIRNALSDGLTVNLVPSSENKKGAEIVIGPTNRDISSKAYKNLDKIDVSSDTELRYLIYSDGKNVAIAYDVDKFETNAAAMTVLDIFLE